MSPQVTVIGWQGSSLASQHASRSEGQLKGEQASSKPLVPVWVSSIGQMVRCKKSKMGGQLRGGSNTDHRQSDCKMYPKMAGNGLKSSCG